MNAGDYIDGRYRIHRILGGGGMGVVYLAEHTPSGRRVAIKEIRPEYVADPEARQHLELRFELEGEMGRAVFGQEFLVPCLETLRVGGTTLHVMEFVDGPTLAQHCLGRHGEVTAEFLLRLIAHLASASAYLHALRYTVRDIKPKNVFVVDDARYAGRKRFRLADFGIGRDVRATDDARTRLALTVGFLGSRPYAAPEQQLVSNVTSPRIDVFQIASTAFWACTGRHVYGKGNSLSPAAQAELDHYERSIARHRADLPRALDELLARCLSKDPEDRPQDGGELLREVLACAATLGILVGYESLPPATTHKASDANSGTTDRAAYDGPSPSAGASSVAPSVVKTSPPTPPQQEPTPPTSAAAPTAISTLVPDQSAARGGEAEPPRVIPALPDDPPRRAGDHWQYALAAVMVAGSLALLLWVLRGDATTQAEALEPHHLPDAAVTVPHPVDPAPSQDIRHGQDASAPSAEGESDAAHHVALGRANEAAALPRPSRHQSANDDVADSATRASTAGHRGSVRPSTRVAPHSTSSLRPPDAVPCGQINPATGLMRICMQ